MRRHYKLFLEDMLTSAQNVEQYVGELSMEVFVADKMRLDAVLRKNKLPSLIEHLKVAIDAEQ